MPSYDFSDSHRPPRRKTEKELPPHLPEVIAKSPLWKYPSIDVFAKRHRMGTEAEHQWEAWEIKQWNEENHDFRAWAFAIIDDRGSKGRWLFLVAPGRGDAMIPKDGEKCKMKFNSGPFILVTKPSGREAWVPDFSKNIMREAVRVDNPCSALGITDSHWEKCLAFEVDGSLERMKAVTSLKKIRADGRVPRETDPGVQHCFVGFELRTSTSTRDAELNALSELMKMRSDNRDADRYTLAAFNYMVMGDGGAWSFARSLLTSFPHMASLLKDEPGPPPKLVEMIRKLDSQQTAAYQQLLSMCLNGVCFVNGGPGAGKTHFLLLVALFMQAKNERRTSEGLIRKKNKLLYLVDMNLPVRDAANRMARLYKQLGWPGTVIHMSCWSQEAKSVGREEIEKLRDKLTEDHAGLRKLEFADAEAAPPEFRGLKFSTAFLAAQMNLKLREKKLKSTPEKNPANAEHGCQAQGLGVTVPISEEGLKTEGAQQTRKDAEAITTAMTLHEAAVIYLLAHTGEYRILCGLLDNVVAGYDDLLEHELRVLYHNTIKASSCVFTTPVTASKFAGALATGLDPALVIFDEAPHARELSTLIPIAKFNPYVWLYGGDPNQTQPYVRTADMRPNVNAYGSQLKISAMARACKRGPKIPSLYINHRAQGGLQELASMLFYDSKMVPASNDLPQSSLWLREHCIMKYKKEDREAEVSRLLMVLKDCKPSQTESEESFSRYNAQHHAMAMNIVKDLLDDSSFRQTSGEQGTILIISHYRYAAVLYKKAINEMKTKKKEWKDRKVESRTIDTSQGFEADVVILDTVHHDVTEHLLDDHRLCVALTRACQAEFILMHPQLVGQLKRLHNKAKLAQVVKYCKEKGSYVELPSRK